MRFGKTKGVGQDFLSHQLFGDLFGVSEFDIIADLIAAIVTVHILSSFIFLFSTWPRPSNKKENKKNRHYHFQIKIASRVE